MVCDDLWCDRVVGGCDWSRGGCCAFCPFGRHVIWLFAYPVLAPTAKSL